MKMLNVIMNINEVTRHCAFGSKIERIIKSNIRGKMFMKFKIEAHFIIAFEGLGA